MASLRTLVQYGKHLDPPRFTVSRKGLGTNGRRFPAGTAPIRPTMAIAGPCAIMTAKVARLRLALFQPDIPQNAGTMLRTCACLRVGADLIEPAGFLASDRHFRRSGMDYLDRVDLVRHSSFAAFQQRRLASPGGRLVLLTTRASLNYLDFGFASDDVVMVGRESAGVPDEVHAGADARVNIAVASGLRSLNVAVAAAMVLGEALRQLR